MVLKPKAKQHHSEELLDYAFFDLSVFFRVISHIFKVYLLALFLSSAIISGVMVS